MAKKKQVEKGEAPSAAKVMQERPCEKCGFRGKEEICRRCSVEHDQFSKGDATVTLSLHKAEGGVESAGPLTMKEFKDLPKTISELDPEIVKHGAHTSTPFGDKGHVLHEYEDGMVQLDNGLIVSREAMEKGLALADLISKKKPVQVDLEGEPVKVKIIEDEETVIAHFRFFRHGSFYLRIKDEALEKLLTQKKKESDEDFQDRVLSTVQKRVKISTDFPVGREEYDAAWTKIFDRLFEI